jgi:hypothetical protein
MIFGWLIASSLENVARNNVFRLVHFWETYSYETMLPGLYIFEKHALETIFPALFIFGKHG